MNHQYELLDAFNMDEDDLAQNRMGRLTETQKHYLEASEFWAISTDILFFIAIMTFFVGCFPLVFLIVISAQSYWFGLTLIGMALVFAVLMRYWRHLPFMNPTERAYTLRAWDGQRRIPDFQVNYLEASTKPKEALWVLQPGRCYRFYYVEISLPLIRDRVVVLGAEDLEPNPYLMSQP